MSFDELLDRIYFYDTEVFAHDVLAVFKKYRTHEEVYFHNSPGNDLYEWFKKERPILVAYNCNNYDKHILRCWIGGMSPEEIKRVNDHIISGNSGWDFDVGYVELPIMWDLFNEINPRKALKEIEGNLRLDITETTIPFDLPDKWNDQQFAEVLYYCEHDVDALFPLFEKLKTDYKSKYIICKLGNIDPVFGLSQTNANLTAILLRATKHDYTDNFAYKYPSIIDKNKIPKAALDYFDDIIAHNDLDYNPPAPNLELRDIFFQIGVGGGHGFIKEGSYIYDRDKSDRVLCNWDFGSLYPNIVRIFGYNSRSQEDKKAYVDLLSMRMKSKKGLLPPEFLEPLGLTNAEVKLGLKLPLNAYTGALRAVYNNLYDNLQGFSICTTGQLIVLQLIHDLEEVPTLQMVSANTDAVMYEVSPKYKAQADEIIHKLEKETTLEMEEDNIVRIIMRDVNNYCELVQKGDDDYGINYKGQVFECDSIRKNLKINWEKETKTWEFEFTDAFKTNSRTICGEAAIKYLLLDIPVEETIENCNDIFRFQVITHLGGTYEKCILAYKDGREIELQRNNRLYAGKEKTGGMIYKIKPDGRKDKLANCPTNPIVDNDNKITIDKIDKKWYIKYAKQKISDFVRKGEIYMEDKLNTLKKGDLIEEVKRLQAELENAGVSEHSSENTVSVNSLNVHQRIDLLRRSMKDYNFILDKVLPSNLGGGEYVSIEQYYQAMQTLCPTVGLDFHFSVLRIDRFDIGAFKPATGAPQNIATVTCEIILTNLDDTDDREYYTEVSQGSDSIDKAVTKASTMAFRNWFDKNFTPSKFNGKVVNFGDNDVNISFDDVVIDSEPTESKPKVFVPPAKKEEIKQEIVSTPQKSDNNDEDVKNLTALIYEYRDKSGDNTAGAKTLDKLFANELSDAEILSKTLAFQNALDSLGEK